MAKTAKVIDMPQPEQSDSTGVNLEASGFKVSIESIAPTGVKYLLQYGFAKSLQDSVSGLKKKLEGEGQDAASVQAALHSEMQKRFDAIVNGSVGLRGPRAIGIERVMRDVAEEGFKAAWTRTRAARVAKGESDIGPLPKGKDLTARVNEYLAKRGDAIRAEAERRMATVAQVEETLDLD